MFQPTICKTCGTIQADKPAGSGWLELTLWLCCAVPGLIYSIWRRFLKRTACTVCGSDALIDGGSPVGRMLLRNQHLRAASQPKSSGLPMSAASALPSGRTAA